MTGDTIKALNNLAKDVEDVIGCVRELNNMLVVLRKENEELTEELGYYKSRFEEESYPCG